MSKTQTEFKFAVIATDIAILTIKDEELNVLLVKMKKDIFKGSWALPGGLVKPDESVDSSAKRNLFEKTKMRNVYLEQLYTFGEINRDPSGRVVSVAYFALIPASDINLIMLEDTYWFPIDRLPKLAYDHGEIIDTAVNRLRSKLSYTNISYGLLPEEFALSDLQKTYEIILGRNLDKRNFRKKITSLNLLKKTGNKTSGKAHRPAYLYRFVDRSPRVAQIM